MQVQRFLEDHGIWFKEIPHSPTFQAQRLAEAMHCSGDQVAKSVLVKADDQYILAILPASHKIDFEKLAYELGTENINLVDEQETQGVFSDCALGAIPPFGSQYGIRTLVDEPLLDEEEIAFTGNQHNMAFVMKAQDLIALEHPQVRTFSRHI